MPVNKDIASQLVALLAEDKTMVPAPTGAGDVAKVVRVNASHDDFELHAPTGADASYDHTVSGLAATNVKGALDELAAAVAALAVRVTALEP